MYSRVIGCMYVLTYACVSRKNPGDPTEMQAGFSSLPLWRRCSLGQGGRSSGCNFSLGCHPGPLLRYVLHTVNTLLKYS